ncbi:MAG: prefoldin subunit alpha [Nanopusillaceae archaeon]|jgi:prefoldin alpha subunit
MENYDEILEYLYQQKEEIEKRIVEYSLIKQYLNDLKKQDQTYINLGGYIFVKGSILDDSTLLINAGRNIFVEKNKEEVLKMVEDVLNKLNQELDNINKKISEITNQKKTLQS